MKKMQNPRQNTKHKKHHATTRNHFDSIINIDDANYVRCEINKIFTWVYVNNLSLNKENTFCFLNSALQMPFLAY